MKPISLKSHEVLAALKAKGRLTDRSGLQLDENKLTELQVYRNDLFETKIKLANALVPHSTTCHLLEETQQTLNTQRDVLAGAYREAIIAIEYPNQTYQTIKKLGKKKVDEAVEALIEEDEFAIDIAVNDVRERKAKSFDVAFAAEYPRR